MSNFASQSRKQKKGSTPDISLAGDVVEYYVKV